MIAFIIVLIYFAIEYLAFRNLKNESNRDFPQHIYTSLLFLAWPWWLFFISAAYSGERRKILYSALIGIIHSFSQTAVLVLCWNSEVFPLGEVLAIPGAIALLLSLSYFFWNKKELQKNQKQP